MTPMIDVTFQLIAFFMFVLNYTEVDQDQRINLPSSELARPPEVAYEEPLTIQLAGDEKIYFAGDELTPSGLKAALLREAQIIKTNPKKKVSERHGHHPGRQSSQGRQGARNHSTVPTSGVRYLRAPRKTERYFDPDRVIEICHRDYEEEMKRDINRI